MALVVVVTVGHLRKSKEEEKTVERLGGLVAGVNGSIATDASQAGVCHNQWDRDDRNGPPGKMDVDKESVAVRKRRGPGTTEAESMRYGRPFIAPTKASESDRHLPVKHLRDKQKEG